MLEKYIKSISSLSSFTKEDILVNDFLITKSDELEIYYAPHNEYINDQANVFIIGITPGWQQTSIAYKTAKESFLLGANFNEIRKSCKLSARFAGTMRKNLYEMLDELELNKKLNIKSCESLFYENSNLLHTTSIIPYPVFIKGKNYTGHNPEILKNDILKYYVDNHFINEIKKNTKALIIPLGKSSEEVLKYLISKNLIDKNKCLFGFPHPSGANGHRKKFFEANKEKMKETIKKWNY